MLSVCWIRCVAMAISGSAISGLGRSSLHHGAESTIRIQRESIYFNGHLQRVFAHLFPECLHVSIEFSDSIVVRCRIDTYSSCVKITIRISIETSYFFIFCLQILYVVMAAMWRARVLQCFFPFHSSGKNPLIDVFIVWKGNYFACIEFCKITNTGCQIAMCRRGQNEVKRGDRPACDDD